MGGYDRILDDVCNSNGQAAEIGKRYNKIFQPRQKEDLLALGVQRLLSMREEDFSEDAIRPHVSLLHFMRELGHRDEVATALDITNALFLYSERLVRAKGGYKETGQPFAWASAHQQLVGSVISRY